MEGRQSQGDPTRAGICGWANKLDCALTAPSLHGRALALLGSAPTKNNVSTVSSLPFPPERLMFSRHHPSIIWRRLIQNLGKSI